MIDVVIVVIVVMLAYTLLSAAVLAVEVGAVYLAVAVEAVLAVAVEVTGLVVTVGAFILVEVVVLMVVGAVSENAVVLVVVIRVAVVIFVFVSVVSYLAMLSLCVEVTHLVRVVAVVLDVDVIFADCKAVVFIVGAVMKAIFEYIVLFGVPLSEYIKHCFLITGCRTFLGLGLDLLQISLGTSRHCSEGDNFMASLFTSLQLVSSSR